LSLPSLVKPTNPYWHTTREKGLPFLLGILTDRAFVPPGQTKGVFVVVVVLAAAARVEAGRFSSHIVHFSSALAGFFNIHIEHVHSFPPSSTFFWDSVGLSVLGRGASQIVHFSIALAGFLSMQSPHVQSAPPACVAGFVTEKLEIISGRLKSNTFRLICCAASLDALSVTLSLPLADTKGILNV
jgi:hypothetical protein